MVFSTEVSDIKQACRNLDFTIISKSKTGVKDDMLMRLDAVTGKALMTMKYKDTRYTYVNNYTATHAHADDDAYKGMVEQWEKDKADAKKMEEEEAAERRANFRRNNNVIAPDFNRVESRTNEQEKAELERAGVTNDVLREELIKKKMEEFTANNWTVDVCRGVATKEVDDMIARQKIIAQAEVAAKHQNWDERSKQAYILHRLKSKGLEFKLDETKVIVSSTVYDPLNENTAQAGDWFFRKEFGLWHKRKNGKH